MLTFHAVILPLELCGKHGLKMPNQEQTINATNIIQKQRTSQNVKFEKKSTRGPKLDIVLSHLTHVEVYICTYVYIYMYIYIKHVFIKRQFNKTKK